MSEVEEQYWLLTRTAPGGSGHSGPVGFYNQHLQVPVLMVFTEREHAVRHIISERGAAHGGPGVLEVQPLPAEDFKRFAQQHPEIFIAFDVPPDTPMPASADELTPIQEFAATL